MSTPLAIFWKFAPFFAGALLFWAGVLTGARLTRPAARKTKTLNRKS